MGIANKIVKVITREHFLPAPPATFQKKRKPCRFQQG